MHKNQRFNISNLYIEVTSSCNLRCKHCYNASGLQGKELPLSLLRQVIQQAKEHGLNFVSLSGGEPLLYQHIWELMDYLKEMGIFFLLITNGTCLNSEVIHNLKQYNCNIQLSLDGPDPETHNAIRGEGAFERAISNMKELRKSNFEGNIVIKGVITSHITEPEIQKYKLLAKELGAVKVEYGWLNRTGRGKNNYEELFVGENEISKYIAMVKRNKYKDDKLEITDIGYTDKCPLVSIENNPLDISPKITFNGEVFPCQMFVDQEFSLGNIYKQSFISCIEGERFLKLLNLLELRSEFMPKCQNCIHKAYCVRGCPALGVNQGSLFDCDEFCGIRKMENIQKLQERFSCLKRGK